jgi:hypothetical protein
MPTETRIFLESKPVAGSTAGHMYLVLRDVEVNASGEITSNVALTSDQVIRGDSGIGLSVTTGPPE